MKRLFCVFLAVLLIGLCMLPVEASAQAKKAAAKAAAPEAGAVTQAQLAQLLVQVLGLSRFLPPNPSDQQCFTVLLENSIVPQNGWEPEKIVTKADLARVIVQALKKQGDIKNPDDPKEWMDYLKGLGIPLDAVGETVYYVDPLAEPVAPHVVVAKVDPLTKRHRFNPIDETQYGVDMEFINRIITQFEFIAGEFRPRPVTPD